MCDVAARCPSCHRDLAAYETKCSAEIQSTSRPQWPHDQTVTRRAEHKYACPCGAVVTVTEPVPGLIQTRQDAVVGP